MSGMLRKGMSWLGLGPDEDYDDYDFVDDQLDYDDTASGPVATGQSLGPAVRPVQPAQRPQVVSEDWDEPEPGGIRVLPASAPAPDGSRPRGVVRPLPTAASARPQVVSPKSFNDAQEVGDLFKRRQPVILNLQNLDRDLARRLLDFASGVAYGLAGTVERVASHVYLITPADMEVSADDRRRIKEGALS
jgi:cell division inhibitor SepF